MSNLATYIEARETLGKLVRSASEKDEPCDAANNPAGSDILGKTPATNGLGLSADEFSQVMAESQTRELKSSPQD